uniref:Uncharacterized protein n=1 Tax=Candidatus Kentrum sp. FW TaxID=2126338 RepID=A0A450TLP4_9GAMM|nr:MAG: hypothetical protein BECKFW1821C_GA0114237_101512 [Candidatus Kentron sp. FW]
MLHIEALGTRPLDSARGPVSERSRTTVAERSRGTVAERSRGIRQSNLLVELHSIFPG